MQIISRQQFSTAEEERQLPFLNKAGGQRWSDLRATIAHSKVYFLNLLMMDDLTFDIPLRKNSGRLPIAH